MKRAILWAMPFVSAVVLVACSPGGSADDAGEAQTDALGAAAAGVAATIRSEAAGRPIPRRGLPDFVETMEGGSYMTSSSGENALRTSGMLLYAAPGPASEVIAFHRASMERQGMSPGAPITQTVRNTVETSIEGQSSDGRSKLAVVVIDKSEPTVPVQMNFSSEKG